MEVKAISIEEKTSSDNNNDDETLSQSSIEGNFQCKNKNKFDLEISIKKILK